MNNTHNLDLAHFRIKSPVQQPRKSSCPSQRANKSLKKLINMKVLPPLYPQTDKKNQYLKPSDTDQLINISNSQNDSFSDYPITDRPTAFFGFNEEHQQSTPKLAFQESPTLPCSMESCVLSITFGRNEDQKIDGAGKNRQKENEIHTSQKKKVFIEITNTEQKGNRKLFSRYQTNNEENISVRELKFNPAKYESIYRKDLRTLSTIENANIKNNDAQKSKPQIKLPPLPLSNRKL